MVFDRVVAALGLFREVSLSLTCPAHCHPSTIVPFVTGLSLGFLLGICSATYLIWIFWFSQPGLHPVPSAPPPAFPRGSRRPRLCGYLDEWSLCAALSVRPAIYPRGCPHPIGGFCPPCISLWWLLDLWTFGRSCWLANEHPVDKTDVGRKKRVSLKNYLILLVCDDLCNFRYPHRDRPRDISHGFSNSGIRRAEAWNDDSPPPPPPRPPRLALRILCSFHL